jgi:hypothetical protein
MCISAMHSMFEAESQPRVQIQIQSTAESPSAKTASSKRHHQNGIIKTASSKRHHQQQAQQEKYQSLCWHRTLQ